MKKVSIALLCILMAFAGVSCKKMVNSPDSIDLTKYNPNAPEECWEISTKVHGFSVTFYEWGNEYTIAASAKYLLETYERTGATGYSVSWKKSSAKDEQSCAAKNQK